MNKRKIKDIIKRFLIKLSGGGTRELIMAKVIH